MEKMTQIISEGNGQLSSIRIGMLAWLIGTLGTWIFVSIKNLAMADIPTSVLTILGLVITGKVISKPMEKDVICDPNTENKQ